MKIAIIQKRVETAVSYYRLAPLIALCRVKGWQMALFHPKELTEDVLHYFDLVFAHRPIEYFEVKALWAAKKMGVPTWVDIDDLLWKIPLHNPALLHHGPDERENLLTAFLNADVITCSTDALADEIQTEVGRTAVTIPNAWDDRAADPQPFDMEPKQVRVLYRGSNTHDGDLFTHREAFREYEGLQFSFMGALPWYFATAYGGHLKQLYHEAWTNSFQSYVQRLRDINPTYMVIPLEDNAFNRAKSNIAAIEAYMYAGAIPVYPSYLPEFAKMPGIPYDNPQHLKGVFEELSATKPALLADVHKAGVEYVRNVLPLSLVNDAREQVIEYVTAQNKMTA